MQACLPAAGAQTLYVWMDASFSQAQRYFDFLASTVDGQEGGEPYAAPHVVAALKQVHSKYVPRYDLSACIAGRDKSFKGRVYFWSDLHVGHPGIIFFARRPFDTVNNMNAALLRNCLTRVTSKDILVFGGDISMENATVANAFLRAIPAYKVLVLGNHDTDENGLLDLAVDETAAMLDIQASKCSVLVTHYPVPESLLLPNQVNLHGHTHNRKFPPQLGSGSRHSNMSVETIRFTPQLLSDLLV